MSITLTLTDNIGDCWADTAGNFSSGGSPDFFLFIGATDVGDRNPRTWFPFTVNLAKGIHVISATLKLIAAAASAPAYTSTIKVGCEAADNPSTPTTKVDLYARTMSTANSNLTLGVYVLDTEFTYDVTAAVQEILNRAGWASGNVLAVMVDDVNTTDKPHRIYSFEAASGAHKPVLEIVVPNYIPRSAGLI
jgi:hypothetical protein